MNMFRIFENSLSFILILNIDINSYKSYPLKLFIIIKIGQNF